MWRFLNNIDLDDHFLSKETNFLTIKSVIDALDALIEQIRQCNFTGFVRSEPRNRNIIYHSIEFIRIYEHQFLREGLLATVLDQNHQLYCIVMNITHELLRHDLGIETVQLR